MLVEEPGDWHITSSSDEEPLVIMLSDKLIEKYQEIRVAISKVEIIDLSLDDEILPDILTQLVGVLSIDLGPVRASIGLFALALCELCKRTVVRGYTVTTTPAIIGKAAIGETKVGQTKYEIESVDLDDYSVTDR
jgi:hypothetical protein